LASAKNGVITDEHGNAVNLPGGRAAAQSEKNSGATSPSNQTSETEGTKIQDAVDKSLYNSNHTNK